MIILCLMIIPVAGNKKSGSPRVAGRGRLEFLGFLLWVLQSSMVVLQRTSLWGNLETRQIHFFSWALNLAVKRALGPTRASSTSFSYKPLLQACAYVRNSYEVHSLQRNEPL